MVECRFLVSAKDGTLRINTWNLCHGGESGERELSRLPGEMAEMMGSSKNEDTRCMSWGDENHSTNTALSPLHVYRLTSIVLRTSTLRL